MVYGLNVQGDRCGVYGESVMVGGDRESTNEGVGVHGFGENFGVVGNGNRGIAGVYGQNNRDHIGTIGAAMGGGTGVVGASLQALGNPLATWQEIPSTSTGGSGTGVWGISGKGTGVQGQSESGVGIFGTSTSGLAGQFDGNVQVNGDLAVTGNKAFVQGHPTDPDREIVYVALEGGEAGTYVRGSGQLQSGKAVLALPEHFGLVTASEGLTVHLTPRGQWLQLYVVELDTAQLVVREAQGKSGTFDYLIQGVRRGFEQHEVIRSKR